MLVVQPVAPQLPWWSFPGRGELLVLEAHHPLRCQNHGHADRPAMAHRIRKVLWRESPCRGVEKLGNARLVKHMLFLRNKLISFFYNAILQPRASISMVERASGTGASGS